MHSRSPDWVFGGGAVDFVDEDDVGEHRTGPELEALFTLVVDVGSHHVGGQQVRGALDAGELAVDRTGERARQRGLPHARIVLDQRMSLGHQGDEEMIERLAAHLNGAADVLPDPPDDRG